MGRGAFCFCCFFVFLFFEIESRGLYWVLWLARDFHCVLQSSALFTWSWPIVTTLCLAVCLAVLPAGTSGAYKCPGRAGNRAHNAEGWEGSTYAKDARTPQFNSARTRRVDGEPPFKEEILEQS